MLNLRDGGSSPLIASILADAVPIVQVSNFIWRIPPDKASLHSPENWLKTREAISI
jgi:hypothetical protein